MEILLLLYLAIGVLLGEDGPLGGPSGDLFVTTRVAPSPIFASTR